MKKCIGYEILFWLFIKQFNDNDIIYYHAIGITGMISVSMNED